ncbi:VIT domain-containing protein [Hydrogenophaga sp.]|uniref:VIT domain-containing protein n=1 Tax=Hydrogenophaga sp. TaxID=1904254 RepID=UPI003F72C89C
MVSPFGLPRRPAPRLRRILWPASTLLVSLAALLPPAWAQHASDPPMVPIRWVTPEARLPVELRRVDVRAEIVGRSVNTRVELELYNPNARVLEAELQFPLLEGQSVTGFALDIDGELRPAVPVEKVKGRQVFEDVTRARVDPALLEVTAGQYHKLRVYPLPGLASRRVVLELGEVVAGEGVVTWRLPLAPQPRTGRLDISVRVAGVAPRAVSARLGAQRLPVRGESGGTRIALAAVGSRTGEELRVALPPPSAPIVATQRFEGEDHFYAELSLAALHAERPRPRRVGLVWDASGSGVRRDHARELALLQAWWRELGDVEVLLQPVRDVAGPLERFEVKAGRWDALRERLLAMRYDGATRAGALRAPEGVDIALLFSDGLGNWGGIESQALPAQPVPTFAVMSVAGSDANALRRMAQASGAALMDLRSLRTDQALAALTLESLRVVSVTAEGAEDLELASIYPEQGRVAVAGRLSAPEARIELRLQAPGGAVQTRTLRVASTKRAGKHDGVAAHRWAALRMARLAAQGESQRAAMRRLGLRFRVPSGETSLIVLDRVEDYARHDIEPPAPLRAQWALLRGESDSREVAARAQHLERVATQFASKVQWWEKDFPKDTPPPKPKAAPLVGSSPPAPAPAAVMSMAAPAAESRREAAAASIQLRPWQPDAPYARRLREATPEALEAVYFDERPSYASSSAFFLDAADILFERGERAAALRVLSNLAEMELENRHVLRILAYRLLQAGEVQTALPLLEKVLAISPDEPQSWRDLGLAQARAGQPQRAVDQLWQVVSRPWNGRFPGVELIALAELNAVVAQAEAAGTPIETRAIDPRLLRHLPLDLRAVLSWDADNTDIDLWVIDPNDEAAFYGNRITYQGGRMSADFTGGYGPEEFSLRKAKPGTYTVRARFYGHRQQIVAPATTLMLRLTTGFGTPAQKDEDVVLRLSGRGDMVTVGTFTIDETSKP